MAQSRGEGRVEQEAADDVDAAVEEHQDEVDQVDDATRPSRPTQNTRREARRAAQPTQAGLAPTSHRSAQTNWPITVSAKKRVVGNRRLHYASTQGMAVAGSGLGPSSRKTETAPITQLDRDLSP